MRTRATATSTDAVVLEGRRRALLVRHAATAIAAAAFAAVLVGWLTGGGSIDLPWAPTLGIRLSFSLDGLGVLYSLLATGVGLAVIIYSGRYLPLHLAHQRRAAGDEARFHALILLFMVSMVGLATAQDLLLLFLFWDLTAVASYLLIGFDRQHEDARDSALMALLVTGISAILLLVAAMMLAHHTGSFSIPDALTAGEGTLVTTAAVLIAVAGLAKCAQMPLHFWLPRAMAAPTPVSAYLHSAAMVAAGVFLLSRFSPLIAEAGALGDVLIWVGLVSGVIGGVIALTRDDLKQLLAYSTIAQYGYVVFLLGIGGATGAGAAAFYVLAHAPAKSALFLVAGTVSEATGERRLSRLGGLWRSMPRTALAAATAGAALAALPLTVGFFKDELLFAAARDHGPLFAVAAVALATLTFAYVWRFFSGVFLGTLRARAVRVPAALVWTPVLLGLLTVVTGVWVAPVNRLASEAGEATAGVAVDVAAAYHLTSPETFMALGAYAAGVLVILTRRHWIGFANGVARAGRTLGPARWYRGSLALLTRVSTDIHDIEQRDLRGRVASVLIPSGLLTLAGLLATPLSGTYRVGSIADDDFWLILALLAASAAAVTTTLPRHHLTLVLILSTVGLNLALAYAFFGAADVALVAVLVEITVTVLFLGVLALLPKRLLRRESSLPTPRTRRWRDPLIGIGAGVVAGLVAWGALSRPTPEGRIADEHVRLAPEAHAKDVVTAILADFRGLDTLVEINVILVAMIGVATLILWRRTRP